MKRYSYILLFVILGSIVIGSCKKKDNEEDDPIPQIKILNVSAYELVQFEENLTITLEYLDNDGDLGDIEPDTLSLSVHDSRLGSADRYHVKPLSPAGFNLRVSGVMDVVIPAPFLLGGSTSELVTYTIKIKDRAGNWSNEVATEEITIKPE